MLHLVVFKFSFWKTSLMMNDEKKSCLILPVGVSIVLLKVGHRLPNTETEQMKNEEEKSQYWKISTLTKRWNEKRMTTFNLLTRIVKNSKQTMYLMLASLNTSKS